MQWGKIAGRRGAHVERARVGQRWLRGLAFVLLLAAIHACSVRDPWQDARIESEIKARLVEEKSANLTRLGVVSRHAVVYLSGTVKSPDEKALAEGIARSVGAVRRVVSNIDIRSPNG